MAKDNLFYQANEFWDNGDLKNAFDLFMLAAKGGDTNAQSSVAYFFDNGLGVKKDKKKALFWYRKAARKGDVVAYNNIAILYRESNNYKRARFWFLKALNGGDGDAALELAKLYLIKQTKINLLKALEYLHLVPKSKNVTDASIEEAKKILKDLC